MSTPGRDSDEPIRINERSLFSDRRKPVSTDKERIHLSLAAPAGFIAKDTDTPQTRDDRISLLGYVSNLDEFNGVRIPDSLELLTAGNIGTFSESYEQKLTTDDLLFASLALTSLVAVTRLRERVVLSHIEGYDGDLEKAMQQDPAGEFLGLSRKRFKRHRLPEKFSLEHAAQRTYHGDERVFEPSKMRADAKLNMPRFSEDISRLRVGAEMASQEIDRLFAIEAVKKYYRYLEEGLGSPLRGKERMLLRSDPRLDTVSSSDMQVLDYIARADGRLLNEQSLHYIAEPDGGLPDSINHDLVIAKQLYARDRKDRFSITKAQTFSGAPIEYIPSNLEMTKKLTEPEREAIRVTPPEAIRTSIKPEELERFRREQEAKNTDRRADRLARRKARIENGNEVDPSDAEVIDYLNGLVDSQAELLAPYRTQSSKHLRTRGVVGSDSLDYHLRQSKLQRKDGFDSAVRLYDGLHTLISTNEDPVEELKDTRTSLAEILEAYHASQSGHQNLRAKQLQPDIDFDLEWLHANWKTFTSVKNLSKSASFIIADDHDKIYELLASSIREAQPTVDETEQGSDIPLSVDEEELSPEPFQEPELTTGEIAVMDRDERNALDIPIEAISRANALAEQLEWVVLPDEYLTPSMIIDSIPKEYEPKLRGKIDEARMARLLKFREEYNGTLYRSSERMLGDSNNLYFVLSFQHPGDERTYAIAENVVMGNATYVIREDVMPLQPGETVLSAVRLSRRDVRELGGKRIVHTANGPKDHSEKIIDAITKLSDQPSLLD